MERTNNVIKGYHVRKDGTINSEKAYFWHIPKALRYLDIKYGDIVLCRTGRGNRLSKVVVDHSFREDVEDTGVYYKQVTKKIGHQTNLPLILSISEDEFNVIIMTDGSIFIGRISNSIRYRLVSNDMDIQLIDSLKCQFKTMRIYQGGVVYFRGMIIHYQNASDKNNELLDRLIEELDCIIENKKLEILKEVANK